MSLTVKELIEVNELGLTLLNTGGANALLHHIVWVHQSEILDSRQFSEPGEILLTVGLNLPQESKEPSKPTSSSDAARYRSLCDNYVREMYEAGVLACGFGVGVKHAEVPRELLAAARRHHLPLFEVPLEIPFQSIEKVVYHSLVDDEYGDIRATYSAQHRLISAAATAKNPMHSVILRTAESVGGWAAFLSKDGAVADISHIGPRGLARNLGLEFIESRRMHAVHQRPAKTMFFLRGERDCCICEVLDNDQRTVGFVVAGIKKSEKTDMILRSIVMVAAEVLSVSMTRENSRVQRLSHMRSTLIRSAAKGNVELIRQMADDLWGGLPKEPVEVLYVKPAQERPDGLDGIYETLSAHADVAPDAFGRTTIAKPLMFGYYDSGLWVLSNASDDHQELDAMIANADLTAGQSSPHVWEDIVQAFGEARVAARLAEFADIEPRTTSPSAGPQRQVSDGEPRPALMKVERIASLSQMDLMNPSIAEIYAQAVLSPLTGTDKNMPRTRSVLLATLHTLVDCSFNSAQCAKRLGVHRHTVENRISRIQQLLGMDFTRVEDIARVWFAIESLKRRNAQMFDVFVEPEDA